MSPPKINPDEFWGFDSKGTIFEEYTPLFKAFHIVHPGMKQVREAFWYEVEDYLEVGIKKEHIQAIMTYVKAWDKYFINSINN